MDTGPHPPHKPLLSSHSDDSRKVYSWDSRSILYCMSHSSVLGIPYDIHSDLSLPHSFRWQRSSCIDMLRFKPIIFLKAYSFIRVKSNINWLAKLTLANIPRHQILSIRPIVTSNALVTIRSFCIILAVDTDTTSIITVIYIQRCFVSICLFIVEAIITMTVAVAFYINLNSQGLNII